MHLHLLLCLVLLLLRNVKARESGEDFWVNEGHGLRTTAVDGVSVLRVAQVLAWVAGRVIDARVHAEACPVGIRRLEHDFEALLPIQADA